MALAQASIVTPGDWIELDLNPATRRTSIRRAVRQAVTRSRSLAPDAVRLIGLLDSMSMHAVESGAFYCASRVIEDAVNGLLVANVLLQVCPSDVAQPPGSASLRMGERCAALADVIRNDPEWAGADVRVVPLPFVGSAVRVHIEDSAILLQYLVPVAGGLADAILSFSCLCPPYARAMTELFDAMAESLVFHYD